jgi:hypothetical protein
VLFTLDPELCILPMIRRDAGDDWLLISQVDHARIAAEIAEAWGNEPFASLPSRDLLVHAIRHHDDGWTAWEAAPTIDPETGAPRDFLEMPIADAAAIWTRSIEICARRSPWCGLWVSRHFGHLAEIAHERRTDRSDRAAVSAFLAAQQELQPRWRRQIAAAADPEGLAAVETAGYAWLRWFDRFSLWLCCAERFLPEMLPFPDGGAIHLAPRDANRITLDPFPLRDATLLLTVSAARLGRRKRTSDEELRAALNAASLSELSWTLQAP